MIRQEQEAFYQMMTRLKNSRAASLPRDDAIVTEMINGLIVSKPARKYQEITNNNETTTNEPKVWSLTKDGPVLQQESKAASVPGINKMKVINDFINHGRY